MADLEEGEILDSDTEEVYKIFTLLKRIIYNLICQKQTLKRILL